MKTFDSIAILNFYTGTVQVYAVDSDMDLEEIFDKLEIDKDECFWIFGVNNIFIDKYIKSLNIIDEIENPILNGISTFNGKVDEKNIHDIIGFVVDYMQKFGRNITTEEMIAKYYESLSNI